MEPSPTARPLALVTGASSGIGLELARQFLANGFDLVVTAEDTELAAAARELSEASEAAQVYNVQADLRTEAGVEELWRRITDTGRPLEAAALNAGVGAGGSFVDNELERELAVIDLNVRGTVHLAKHVVRHMVDRNAGRILFTSSIAATQPGTYQAIYNASKSFVQSFALALRDELRET